MKILWYSNAPHVGSGYGNQTELFVPRIRARLSHDVAIAAFWGIQGALVISDGVTIYPASASGALNYESMGMAAEHFGADVIISLMDLWVLGSGVNGRVPIAPWFPVDYAPLPPPVAARLKTPDGILNPVASIVFSRFGEAMVRAAGFEPLYVPHGVDTSIFRPYDRNIARQALKLPADAFIIGIVSANLGSPNRKAIKPQIRAFAKLLRAHPDVHLHIHARADASGVGGGATGENLAELVEQLGIERSVSFTEHQQLHYGLEQADLAVLYSAFDVLSNVSMGEGFGIPILEAQACGTPVVVGDWTSMSELNFSGWAVPKERAETWHTSLGAYQWWPLVDGIYEQYDLAYQTWKRRGLAWESNEARRAAADGYDADLITDRFWQPALDEIERRLVKPAPRSFDEYISAADAAAQPEAQPEIGAYNEPIDTQVEGGEPCPSSAS